MPSRIVVATPLNSLVGSILDSCIAKGTWTASETWTLPAITLGGTVSANLQGITNVDYMSIKAAGGIVCVADNSYVVYRGGIDQFAGSIELYGKSHASAPGRISLNTSNAALDIGFSRLIISGAIDTAVATWGNVTHTGLVLTASEKIYPVSGVAGFSVVSTALTLGSLGSVVIPQSAANATDLLAGNIAGAIALDLTGSSERLYFRGASWFYISKTGGLSMTKEERTDPSGHRFEIGDMVRLIVDKVNPDGSFHAMPYYSPN